MSDEYVDVTFGKSNVVNNAHIYFEAPAGLNVSFAQRTFKCKKGHIYRASEPFVVFVNQDPGYRSGPICPYCYVDWHTEQLGAAEEVSDA